MRSLGVRIFGVASLALGIVGCIWLDFTAVWQPVPDGVPGREALAVLAAILFIGGGIAVQIGRTAQIGGVTLGLLYLVFALLWSRRIIGFPWLIGTWSGTAEQVALAVGGLVAYGFAPRSEAQPSLALVRTARLAFGVCLVLFGLAHFFAIKETAAMVPTWIPPGQRFWAYATGVGHLLAGLALLSNIAALLAARLLTVMFVSFGAFVWLPKIFQFPADHTVWAGNSINLALIGAAWAVGDSIANSAALTEASAAEMPRRSGGTAIARTREHAA